jgi:hypothetical protein
MLILLLPWRTCDAAVTDPIWCHGWGAFVALSAPGPPGLALGFLQKKIVAPPGGVGKTEQRKAENNFFAGWCLHSSLDYIAGSFLQHIQQFVELENDCAKACSSSGPGMSTGYMLASVAVAAAILTGSFVSQTLRVSLQSLPVAGWSYKTWYIQLHVVGGVRPCMGRRWACSKWEVKEETGRGGGGYKKGECLLCVVVIDSILNGHRGKPCPAEHEVLRGDPRQRE